ncbi:hypothetical protein K3495_g1410 [Podosphaera aphanis]|nr:hypothetical protein K3495_g1410 [Podosphaera aphanis]
MCSDYEQTEALILSRFFYVTQTTKESFAWIKQEGGPIAQTGESSKDEESEGKGKDIEVREKETEGKNAIGLTSKFEKLGGSWHTEKLKSFEQDTARFFSYLTDHLGGDDQGVFDEYGSAMDVWNHLKAKYSKFSESTASNFMSKIQSFPDKFDVEEKGIDNAWETLKAYRRRLTSADETLKYTYPDKAIFHILTKALPKKYTSIIDSFRPNPRTAVEERLQILLEKEEDSKDYEKAHPALEKGRY